MSFDPPTEGAKRCMIYRLQRTLDDGCKFCGKSRTYCDGLNHMRHDTDAFCCDDCRNAKHDPH